MTYILRELEKIGAAFSTLTQSQKIKFCKKYLKVFDDAPPEFVGSTITVHPSGTQNLAGTFEFDDYQLYVHGPAMVTDIVMRDVSMKVGKTVLENAEYLVTRDFTGQRFQVRYNAKHIPFDPNAPNKRAFAKNFNEMLTEIRLMSSKVTFQP